jgi:hypothetical protein
MKKKEKKKRKGKQLILRFLMSPWLGLLFFFCFDNLFFLSFLCAHVCVAGMQAGQASYLYTAQQVYSGLVNFCAGFTSPNADDVSLTQAVCRLFTPAAAEMLPNPYRQAKRAQPREEQ